MIIILIGCFPLSPQMLSYSISILVIIILIIIIPLIPSLFPWFLSLVPIWSLILFVEIFFKKKKVIYPHNPTFHRFHEGLKRILLVYSLMSIWRNRVLAFVVASFAAFHLKKSQWGYAFKQWGFGGLLSLAYLYIFIAIILSENLLLFFIIVIVIFFIVIFYWFGLVLISLQSIRVH